ncbi:MAG: peroxidase [Acidimicrobiia bacterium]|nr:peroxidase [Acidimicrobiia bacterium]
MHDLRAEVADDELVDRFAADWRTAGLDNATVALLDHAERLTRDPASMGADDVAILSAAGWSERAIHDAVQVCSYFNYINRIADALGVEPEPWMDEVGRVIQQST